MTRGAIVLSSCLLTLLAACGGGPRAKVRTAIETGDPSKATAAYDTFRESEGSEVDLLAQVAAVVLTSASQSEDPLIRKAAVQQLGYAGTSAKATLWKIAEGERNDAARASALWLLSRTGERRATPYLHALLDNDDAEIFSIALAVAAKEDASRITLALSHDDERVRRAAALASMKAPSEAFRIALTQLSRVDPKASVRGAAIRALTTYGATAHDAIRERLSDPTSSVRFAAVRALVQADRERSVPAIASMMSVQPSPAGIEAARVLSFVADQDPTFFEQFPEPVESARAFLHGALMAKDARLRSQAAVAVVTLRSHSGIDGALRRALAAEEDITAKFAIARALYSRPNGEDVSTKAMTLLLEEGGMVAIQAAAFLVRHGNANGESLLIEGVSDETPLIRQVAVRAVARDAMKPEEARRALVDDNVMVRIHAAGAIMASASAQSRK